MSMNGVREEEWKPGQWRPVSSDIRLTEIRRDADGYYTGVIAALVEVELPDGRRVLLNDARAFRGRCLNARKGRPKTTKGDGR